MTTESMSGAGRAELDTVSAGGARPKLLFLAQILPYPPDSGVAIRTYNVLRILARKYEITALCFFREKAHRSGRSVPDALEALSRLARVEAFPIPQEHSPVRLVVDHARSLLTGSAYTRYTYRSDAFRKRLEALLARESFELVHVDSLDLCDYLPLLESLPVICVHHNVESRLMRRRAAAEGSALRGRYLRRQADLLEREERRWCPRISLNVTVSEEDRRELANLVGSGRYAVVPNGVDVQEFVPGPEGNGSIAFLGGTEWFPNVDALRHFGGEILPLLGRGHSLPNVRWIGRATQEERELYRAQFGIELTGYVDDIRPLVHEAACMVVPLRVGGGTRLKITTAWAMGKAVVSTSVGCEGLNAIDGENILIRDTPEGFAEAVRAVLEDRALRQRLERGAREIAVQRYGWDVIGSDMLREYTGVEPAVRT